MSKQPPRSAKRLMLLPFCLTEMRHIDVPDRHYRPITSWVDANPLSPSLSLQASRDLFIWQYLGTGWSSFPLNIFSMLRLLTTFLAASLAAAHFTLDYPETRGFDEDKETQFCGGFGTAATRQPFPLKGPVWINNGHKKATVDAFVSLTSDPKDFNDFNRTLNGTDIPRLTNFFQVGEGEACWNIDFSSLGLDLKNGSEVTLQVRFSGVSVSVAGDTDPSG